MGKKAKVMGGVLKAARRAAREMGVRPGDVMKKMVKAKVGPKKRV